jgi:molybdopterin-guanine dinucleotide biosynthesis protein A
MEAAKRILAVILAGGLARRMEGAGKPLLRLGGARLIDRVCACAKAQGLDVALNLHDQGEAAAFADLGLPLVCDAAPGHAGPLAGILAGLDYAARKRFDAVLSLPCDAPFLPRDLAQRLTQAAEKTRDGLACAASGGRAHPVVALWPVFLREDLRRALLDEQIRAPKRLLGRYDCARVEWSDRPRDPFFNVNTPADLAEAERLSGLVT